MKSVNRCVALSQLLVEQNFPAIAIHRGMAQEERWVLLHTYHGGLFKFGIKIVTSVFSEFCPQGCPGTNSLKTSKGGFWWQPICLAEAWILNESTSCSTMTCRRTLTHTFTESVHFYKDFINDEHWSHFQFNNKEICN